MRVSLRLAVCLDAGAQR